VIDLGHDGHPAGGHGGDETVRRFGRTMAAAANHQTLGRHDEASPTVVA
jgi:hypothetical protein